MKTPERWRPSRVVPSFRYSCLKDMAGRHVTSYDITAWYHVTSYAMVMNLYRPTHQKVKKSCFSTWRPWPMTLTLELIRDIIKVHPSTKFKVCMSNGSAGRALTDRHTDAQTGPILYPRPLTREGIIISRGKLDRSSELNPACQREKKLRWLFSFLSDIIPAHRRARHP